MIIQSRHNGFNISYDEVMRKYFITSKSETDNKPQIGGFEFAADAIIFALDRVKEK